MKARFLTRVFVISTVVGAVVVLMAATPATANPDKSPDESRVSTIDSAERQFLDENLIVLPEELRANGANDEVVTRQEEFVNSLPPDVAKQQAELREREDALTDEYLAGHEYIDSSGVTHPGTEPVDMGEVTPFAYGEACPTHNNVYRVRWVVESNGATTYSCFFPPAGTITTTRNNVTAVNSGTTTGRIYYYRSNNGYYYWSVWRSDGVWHDFYDILYYGGTIRMDKVQIG